MKLKLIHLVLGAMLFTGCTTVYNSGQTPDDLYFSPAETLQEERSGYSKNDRYQEYLNSEDDRYLRMKVRNRDRWSSIDDYNYWYDSRFDHYSYNMYNNPVYGRFGYNNFGVNNFGFNNFGLNNWRYRFNPSFGLGYYNPWQPSFYGYGGYYSPVFPVVYYKNPRVYTGTTNKSNLSSYMNNRYYNSNSRQNNNSNFGNLVKKVLTSPNTGNNNNANTYERPVRTITPGTSNSNAGGRSGGYNSTGSSSSSGRPPRN